MASVLELLFSKLWPWLASVCSFALLVALFCMIGGLTNGIVQIRKEDRK